MREASALLAALHAILRLVVTLEQLAPTSEAAVHLAQARAELDRLTRHVQSTPPTPGQLRALHEQIVLVSCDLRALEPELEELASTTASLDRSLRALAETSKPNEQADDRPASAEQRCRSQDSSNRS